MVKNTNLKEVYSLDENDKKLMKLIVKENIFSKLMESYVAKEYELVEYWVKELMNITSNSKLEDLKKAGNDLVQKLENNEYVLDIELDKIREIINILKISNNI